MNRGLFDTTRRRRNRQFRPMYFEPLEERQVMSAISPIPVTALEVSPRTDDSTEDMVSSVAVYAPAVPETVSIGETLSQGSVVTNHSSNLTSQNTVTHRISPEILDTAWAIAVGLNENGNEIGNEQNTPTDSFNPDIFSPDFGGIPGFPGIPGGDAGGVAGGNGSIAQLPLMIPGFGGYGNAYFLTLSGDSIGRIVWLYAQYFNDQERVVPKMTVLPRAQTSTSNYDSGLFGTSLASSVYYDERPDTQTPERGKRHSDAILGEDGKESRENQIEHHLDQELQRTFRNLLQRKEYLEKRRTPERFPEVTPLYLPGEAIPRESEIQNEYFQPDSKRENLSEGLPNKNETPNFPREDFPRGRFPGVIPTEENLEENLDENPVENGLKEWDNMDNFYDPKRSPFLVPLSGVFPEDYPLEIDSENAHITDALFASRKFTEEWFPRVGSKKSGMEPAPTGQPSSEVIMER